MTRVFLTGASGFLGGHPLRELREAGCQVKALSRRSESDAAIASQGGVSVRSDLADSASLPSALDGCEAVFHAAADTSNQSNSSGLGDPRSQPISFFSKRSCQNCAFGPAMRMPLTEVDGCRLHWKYSTRREMNMLFILHSRR